MSAQDMDEAMRTIGLPESPVIHLAISMVAELLQPLDANCSASKRDKSMVRCRVAARTVFDRWPIEFSRQQYHLHFGTGFNQVAADAASRLPRTNWFEQAKAALEAIGLDPGPDARKMVIHYGWRPDPHSPNSESGGLRYLRQEPLFMKRTPRTAAERSKVLAETIQRVKNATPEQRAAQDKRLAAIRSSSVESLTQGRPGTPASLRFLTTGD